MRAFIPFVKSPETIARLKTLGIKRLELSHCTGFQAGARFAQELGDGVASCMGGYSVTPA